MTHPKLGHTFWWQPTEEDMEEGSFFYLLALLLSAKFICPAAEAFLYLN